MEYETHFCPILHYSMTLQAFPQNQRQDHPQACHIITCTFTIFVFTFTSCSLTRRRFLYWLNWNICFRNEGHISISPFNQNSTLHSMLTFTQGNTSRKFRYFWKKVPISWKRSNLCDFKTYLLFTADLSGDITFVSRVNLICPAFLNWQEGPKISRTGVERVFTLLVRSRTMIGGTVAHSLHHRRFESSKHFTLLNFHAHTSHPPLSPFLNVFTLPLSYPHATSTRCRNSEFFK